MYLQYRSSCGCVLGSFDDSELIDCYRRSTTFHDKNRDSDKDDYQDRDYDVATLENNLSQAFRYGIYNNDDI